MIDIQQKKQEIISFLKMSGPTLPVRIAKAIDMEPVFTSAILSELLGSKDIKTSYLKVGASPLYLIEGQEQKLEEHDDNLNPIEKEAYLKLKGKKFLNDENETPAIRVALRNIKDFAIPFRFQEKIMWKYTFVPDEEIEAMLSPKHKPKPEIKKTETKPEPKEVPKGWNLPKEEKKVEPIFEEEPKPEFLNEIQKFLKEKNIEFLEEIQTEKKQIAAKVSISSKLGDINFLLIAKDKRTISLDEIKSSIQRATHANMPCLIIIRKAPPKNIQKFIDENHLIKFEVMN